MSETHGIWRIGLCVLAGLSSWLACAIGWASPAVAPSDDVQSVGEATNGLALDLYRALGGGQDNLAFSPLSIETAVGTDLRRGTRPDR